MNKSGKADRMADGNTGNEPDATSSSTTGTDDNDFEPTAEMLVYDFDDEVTLNEDEDDNIEANEEELAALTKEGDMPLEQLLALYYGGTTTRAETGSDDKQSQSGNEGDGKKDDDFRQLIRSFSATSDSSDEEDREKFVLHSVTLQQKRPRIGEEFQVVNIPDVATGSLEKYKHYDLQVWSPLNLPEDVVVEYLRKVTVGDSPTVTVAREIDDSSTIIVQDSEDALFLLRQCENNPEEALKRYKARPPPVSNELQIWSENECRQFEDGLSIYGKDFYMIHLNKVYTRSVLEIVKFYYIWKKSERFEQFSAKTRLGKKKEVLSANITDYLGRPTDESDTCNPGASSRSYLKYCAHGVALVEYLKEKNN